MKAVCRPHHDEITFDEPEWAYDLGFLRHSWEARMIPSWLFPILAALPSALLVWGSICLLVLLCMGAGLATHFLLISAPSLLRRWRHVPGRVRTATALAGMGARAIGARSPHRVWIRRLGPWTPTSEGLQRQGIPRKEWWRVSWN